jgi:hypothetical protein
MKMYRLISLFCLLLALNFSIFAQNSVRSQEVSEDDGVPVLIKHLPDWENARNRATFTNNVEDLKIVLGTRPVLDLIDFTGGTEAVTAPYDSGKLLIIEYVTPQASIEADNQFNQKLAENPSNPPTSYRRIGNYSAFVFDAKDEASANALLDQIKYEKTVQWLSEDPNYAQKVERYLARSTADLFVTTFIAIVSTLGLTVLVGVVVGLVFFRIREQKRATTTAFSDAGGMVRLNLDELSSSTPTNKLLSE